jgi:N-acyl-D-amino-acid deacylase
MKRKQVRLVTISQRNETARYGVLRVLRKPISVFLFFIALLTACEEPVPVITSTLITNAVIHNGSGGEAFHGAVRIDGDRIIEIGDFVPLEGETTIDAGGLVLAPGFIDTHSHHDEHLEEYRHMPGALSQGITTITRGMDGFSDISNQVQFTPLAEYKTVFAAAPAAVNIASYSPHNSIRHQILGLDNKREASPEEIQQMSELVAAEMTAGAIGLATGLEYEPGLYSSTEEIIALSKVAAGFNGRYTSHIRDEDDHFIEAVQEIIRIGREAELPVHIAHIKLADREYWGTSNTVLELLDDTISTGVQITADIYPYQRWASGLTILFPDRNYSDRSDAEFTFAHTASPEDIVLSRFSPNPDFNGLSVAEISRITERDPELTLMELAQASDDYFQETGIRGSMIIAKGMDEGDVAALMQWENTNICSDGGHGGGHPRGYGAFPRVLGRFVRELGVLTLQDAVHKMTGLPAKTLGIRNRGRIKTGYYADLVLFDPDTIQDKATMEDSTALSVGIEKVWVNGVLAFDEGEPTMVYPGRIITRDGL